MQNPMSVEKRDPTIVDFDPCSHGFCISEPGLGLSCNRYGTVRGRKRDESKNSFEVRAHVSLSLPPTRCTVKD